MGVDVDITVLGDVGLENMLRRLPGEMQKKILAKSMREVARAIKLNAVQRVPVKTGKLKEELAKADVVAGGGSASRGMLRFGVPFPDRAALGIDAGDKAFYPTTVEYGHGYVKPHPYLRPAVDENRRALLDMLAGAIRAKLFKLAEKLAKRRARLVRSHRGKTLRGQHKRGFKRITKAR